MRAVWLDDRATHERVIASCGSVASRWRWFLFVCSSSQSLSLRASRRPRLSHTTRDGILTFARRMLRLLELLEEQAPKNSCPPHLATWFQFGLIPHARALYLLGPVNHLHISDARLGARPTQVAGQPSLSGALVGALWQFAFLARAKSAPPLPRCPPPPPAPSGLSSQQQQRQLLAGPLTPAAAIGSRPTPRKYAEGDRAARTRTRARAGDS